MTHGCGGLLSEEKPVRRDRPSPSPSPADRPLLPHKPQSVSVWSSFRGHVRRKQVCSGRGRRPSPARAAPPGAAAARPAPAGRYLYGAILVACSDWPVGDDDTPPLA
ncbi:hypothetical protein NN561_006326 [Cricetulus griseus]